jgi:CheY-like chemotaxis protein/anti-sigma regulatory factor (Ser/Thr protein kinase)
VIDSVLTLVRKELETRARLAVSLQDGLQVLGSEARVAQVITNLMMNALHALPAEREPTQEVTVSARRDGKQIVIEVADNGPGVPCADRERIFEPFVTTKPIGLGTGLGLFVCRNIVRALGGEVSVQDRPGGGALFRVTLPAATGSGSRPAVAERELPPVGQLSGRVLVIDDDPIVVRALADRLRGSGLLAEIASDGQEGLDRLLGGAGFDLVYCDLMMRGMTGMDLCEQLAERRPELLRRVVFMTGGAITPRAAAFAEARLDRMVEKPFDIVEDARRRLAAGD